MKKSNRADTGILLTLFVNPFNILMVVTFSFALPLSLLTLYFTQVTNVKLRRQRSELGGVMEDTSGHTPL